MSSSSLPEPATLLDGWRDRFELILAQCLPPETQEPERLHQAMRYSVLAGGKRIRPLLVYGSCHALGLPVSQLDSLASALELIHAYSLIHDDLPAMDDDDWRRGKPTCHLAFDEATAILAGDALQALAFEQLANMETPNLAVSVTMLRKLAEACGSTGMAGGQMLDLKAAGHTVNQAELEHTHLLKTGALICLSAMGPAMFAEAPTQHVEALREFGRCVGLGFQIRDDILDVTGETSKTGKPTQADAARNQPTFPAIIGLAASEARATEMLEQAHAALRRIPGDTAPLAALAEHMIRRDH